MATDAGPHSSIKASGAGVDVADAAAATAGPDTLHRMDEVVKRTGLTPRAIRYYEEVGLLTAASRTAGGFRLFTEADVATLLRIKELQTLLGFSLAEIKESLRIDAARAELRQAYAQATDVSTKLRIVDQADTLLRSQIATIDERVARLMELRRDYTERLERVRLRRAEILEERGGEEEASR
jgi:MerR family transcriptional regulator, repressor of the yfmOP operon